MKGRKPKPTAMKLIAGNPGNRPLNQHEPVPPPGSPTCPPDLGDDARGEWDRITAELDAMGILARTDRAALAAYCAAYGHWMAAERGLRSDGMFYEANGLRKLNPASREARDWLGVMRQYLTEFGLTPSSRTRVTKADGDGSGKRNQPKDKSRFFPNGPAMRPA